MNVTRTLMLALAMGMFVTSGAVIAAQMGTAFTYQGRLESGGNPVTDTCDFEFSLWDDAAAGTQQGLTVPVTISVDDGLFTVNLDFGEQFNGEARWLEMAVCCPSPCAPVPLSPRQELTPAPHALALPGLWTQQSATSPNLIGGYSGNTVTADVYGATIGGGGESGSTNLVTDNYGTVGGGLWNTAGNNAGTTVDASHSTVGGGFYNTASGSDSTVGGGYANTASASGATVGGGWENTASGEYATVGGGHNSVASSEGATVGGGFTNTASGSNATVSGGWANDGSGWCAAVGGGYDNTASGTHSVVGGGVSNQAISARSTVGGGEANVASGQFSTIGGGALNDAIGYCSTVGGGANNEAGADYAVVPGGSKNTAGGQYSLAAGLRAKANHDGTFVWADSTDADFASTAANQFLIRATGGVGLGKNNPSEQLDVEGNIHASGTITSGSSITIDGTTDTITSTGDLELHVSSGRALRIGSNATSPNLIGGYTGNLITPGAVGATISGGGEWLYANHVTDDFGTIGGGAYNRAGDSAGATDDATHATVSGGEQNVAGGSWSTVGGGDSNNATGAYSTVGGGNANEASSSQSTVGGGILNLATALNSTVSGGIGNEASGAGAAVGGGAENTATGTSAVIGGGVYNAAGGYRSTVPGGSNNTADGSYSFAAGRRAKTDVAHQGTFVWADSSDFDFTSTAADEFGARTTGGARFVTAIDGAGAPTAGVKLDPGDNAWETLSDRDAKENFVTLDAREVLRRLGDMPVTQWNYKGQDPSDKHIGPMAQDFYAAFGLSADDRHISTIDADGVALAAIQGLHEIVKEKDAKLAALEARLTALEDVVAAITLKRAQTGGGR